jgi:hypothetical protein
VKPAPYPGDLLTALFGVQAVHVPQHGHRPVEIVVAFACIHGGASPGPGSEAEIKQGGIYQHHVRNRRVARLAQAIAAKDAAQAAGLCPGVGDYLPAGKINVGVLVDDVGHGLTLAGKLGWPLVAAKEVNLTGLSEEDQARIAKSRSGKKPVVVTADGLARAGHFDVIIRADGGVGLPNMPEESLCCRHGVDRKLVIIDFMDRHHPMLRQRSRRRRNAYLAAGWHVVGIEKATPMDEFMAGRPEGIHG